jgi:hypothetical protein
MDILPGLLSFSQWLDDQGKKIKRIPELPGLLAGALQNANPGAWVDQVKKNVAANVQEPGLMLTQLNEDARKFQQDQRANWGDIKSVVPEVKAAGLDEFNRSGQELGGLLGTFAGVGAKTADALKLSKAKAMSVEPKGIISDWRWKGKDKVKQEVGIDELPSYIADNYGQFMKEQRGRADAGQLGARDLLKAYGITRSSVNRGARDISDDLAQGSVRPEGYMAEWLLSPQGKAYLDAAEKGQVNADAVADIQKRFAPFGMANTLANDLTYAAQQLPPINGRVNAAVTGPVDQWREFAQGLNGIGPAKSGFIASLLGRGDLPTLDARQMALHTGKPAKEASKYMRRGGGKGGDAAVDRLAERQKAMGVVMDESLNPFSQHLTHHAVWDKVGGTQTTHEDLIRAMKLAGIGGFGLLGAGAYGQEQ